MNRMPGTRMSEGFLDLDEETRKSYAQQLAAIFVKVRALKSPYGDRVCGTKGDYARSRLLVDHGGPCGPFSSEDALKEALPTLLAGVTRHMPPDILDLGNRHPITFTHGDLLPWNVMVKNGQITAIVDWENAGWFPSNWDELKSYTGYPDDHPLGDCWRKYLAEIFPKLQLDGVYNNDCTVSCNPFRITNSKFPFVLCNVTRHQ